MSRPTLVLCLSAALLLPLSLTAQVQVTPSQDKISVSIEGKPYGDLLFGPDVWKPYFYPLLSASGKQVVRHFPMDPSVAGESHDHNHHRGLWFAHDDVNGYNFWSSDPLNKANPKFGKIVLDKIVSTKSGKKQGSLTVRFNWNGPDGQTLLTEQRTMVLHDDPKLRIIDVDIALTAKQKVTFGDTKEGTFGLRLADPLKEASGGHMVNAQGAEGEKNVWGKPSEWVDYYGTLDGEPLGIAIFDSPRNPGHPVRWHSRAYGLFAANPFGRADFVHDTSQHGGATLQPGQTLRFRYRLVIHPGDTQSAGIAEMYKKWAK